MRQGWDRGTKGVANVQMPVYEAAVPERGHRQVCEGAGGEFDLSLGRAGHRRDARFRRAGRMPSAARAAPRAPAGGTITAVQIQGNVRAEPETIRSYLQLKEGQPYDAGGRRPLAEGAVRDRPVLRRRDRHAGLDPGREGDGESDHQSRRVRGQQQDRGRQAARRGAVQAAPGLHPRARAGRRRAHPHASIAAAAATTPSVEPKIIQLEQGRVDLVFEIDEGDVTGIKRISFVGNEHFSDGTLRGKIRTTESAWWRFLSSDDRFDPDRLNLDRELLRKFYLSEGYADFRVVSAVAELAPDRDGLLHHLHHQRRRALQVRQGRGHDRASRGSMPTRSRAT